MVTTLGRLTGILAILYVMGCRSETEPFPQANWVNGCVDLKPTTTGYQLDPECCTFLTLPPIRLRVDRTFAVDGEYNTFAGAGFAKSPVVVKGFVSPDNQTLSLTYSVNKRTQAFTLAKGERTQRCACYCD